MKIVWNSIAPWIGTGYGQQTAQVCRRLRDAGHDVAISAFAGIEGTIGEWEGITVYPNDVTRFNKRALPNYVRRHSEDGTGNDVLVITLQDVWTWANTEQRTGGQRAEYQGLRLAAWCPVDHDPVPVPVVAALEQYGARPIAMSRFGKDRLKQAGFRALYVPHAVDTNVLVESEDAGRQLREAIGVRDDQFLIGMVSANVFPQSPCRKAFPEVFMAFALFLQEQPDAVLYLHTDVTGLDGGGLHLGALANFIGIPTENLRWANQDKYQMGEIETRHMSYMYSALDVLACPSLGEGFGIPIVEAQACGTPVIVTDWTAMTELAGPAQWLVDGEPFYNPGQVSIWKKPAVSEILARFRDAYAAKGDRDLRAACREFALAYDADRVFADHWVPALEELGKNRTVAALPKLDPKVRKAALKAAKAQAAA